MTFADTSFWVALALRRDLRQEDAQDLWRQRRGRVVTTNHVLGEPWTFLRRRAGHATAREACTLVEASPSVVVAHVPPELEREAWRWLHRNDERACSFVDATSFAFMRRHDVIEAFAFDGDFSGAGFREVRP